MPWRSSIVLTIVLINIIHVEPTSADTANNEIDFRISKGTAATAHQFPYQVSLRKNNDTHICGGTIVAAQLVVTAGHCLFDPITLELIPADKLSVLAGVIDRTDVNNPEAMVMPVERLLVHPKFSKAHFNDYGLLYLSKPLFVNASVKSIAPIQASFQRPAVGTHCNVSGWGETESEPMSKTLRYAQVSIVASDVCATWFNVTKLDKTIICAQGDDNRNVGHGDSGGPLVCNGLLTGVTMTIIKDQKLNGPTMYASIAEAYDWIKNRGSSPFRDGLQQQLLWELALVLGLILWNV